MHAYMYVYTHRLNEVIPLGLTMLPSISNKSFSTWHEIPPFGLSARVFQKTTKTTWTIAVVFSCLPDAEGKPLLLKPPHILETGFRESEQDAFSLKTSLYSTRSYYTSFKEWK